MHNDDEVVGRWLTRRELVALFGASAVAALAHRAEGQTAGPAGRALPACVVQPEQTEGPYFVDERMLRSDIRTDPTNGMAKLGLPLELALKFSDVTTDGKCGPLVGAQVDIWQCDAAGVYSDVRDPSLFNTVGQKFLRGHQITDKSGEVKFLTIYPGWYPDRAIHIHFKVRTTPGADRGYEFTSQLYFDDALTDKIHTREPYASHTGRRMRNPEDFIYRDGGQQLMLAVAEKSNRATAAFDIGVRTSDPPRSRGRRGGGWGGWGGRRG